MRMHAGHTPVGVQSAVRARRSCLLYCYVPKALLKQNKCGMLSDETNTKALKRKRNRQTHMSGETARERSSFSRCTPGSDSRNLKGTHEMPATQVAPDSAGSAGMWRTCARHRLHAHHILTLAR